MEATEEVAEGAVVGVWSAVGAGAALFRGEEGVEGAFPARVELEPEKTVGRVV